MITFTVSLVCLLLGYLIYGAFVERVLGPDHPDTKDVKISIAICREEMRG